MRRRQFLTTSLSGVGLALALPATSSAIELDDDVRVTRVMGFDLPTRRSKLAGKNASKDVHGHTSGDRMLVVFTNSGQHGIGRCHRSEQDIARLLDKRIADLFDADGKRMTGPLGSQTMPLWDLAGKLMDKPVYELLGGKGHERVPVYDGSIYFMDLLPEFAANWQDQLRREIDMGLELGHTVFKIKIGRGNKWMSREEGDERDRQVVKLASQHAAGASQMAVDANNGYNLAGAKECMSAIGEYGIPFAEEMFDETVDECLEFKAYLREKNLDTLLADGETKGDLKDYEPFVKAKAVDVLQGDMNHFGFEGILAEAAMGEPLGIEVAPHNWGSLIGFYAQLQVGRAIPNFYRAEHDPLSSDILIAEGFEIADGKCTVPAVPGLGLDLDMDKLSTTVKPLFDLKT